MVTEKLAAPIPSSRPVVAPIPPDRYHELHQKSFWLINYLEGMDEDGELSTEALYFLDEWFKGTTIGIAEGGPWLDFIPTWKIDIKRAHVSATEIKYIAKILNFHGSSKSLGGARLSALVKKVLADQLSALKKSLPKLDTKRIADIIRNHPFRKNSFYPQSRGYYEDRTHYYSIDFLGLVMTCRATEGTFVRIAVKKVPDAQIADELLLRDNCLVTVAEDEQWLLHGPWIELLEANLLQLENEIETHALYQKASKESTDVQKRCANSSQQVSAAKVLWGEPFPESPESKKQVESDRPAAPVPTKRSFFSRTLTKG